MNADAVVPAFSLRPATLQDASLIYALRAAGLREHVARIWGWDEAEQTARFAEMFDPARYQVVVVAGHDIGALSVDWGEREVFLADIEIDAQWRGRGLGTAVVGVVLAEARRRGLPVALQTLKDNPARRLYERLGFSVTEETPTHDLMRTALVPLGLQRGSVRLVPHHPAWKAIFAAEAERIRAALGDRVLSIEHEGSTAVAGLPAKPIIDIMVGIANLAEASEEIRALEGIGYERRPNGDLPGRLYLVLGTDEVRHMHLSLAEPMSDFWRGHLLFRDRLRADPLVAAAYAKLKQDLAERFPEDRLAYTDGKDAFITEVLAMAGGPTGEVV